MTINELIPLLGQEYGLPQWHSQRDPLSELIRTILSQNTSDVNSHRAFDSLVSTFGTWYRVAEASIDEIAAAIACGGLSRIKSPRIKAILEVILNSQGSLDIGFLGQLPLPEARAWLQALPGVGPKTANCVLLFSLGMPALPVDTHVYRVCRRLGLIDPKVSPARAHQILEELIPAEAIYQFHINVLAHGRRVCRAQRPRCSDCILLEGCVYGKGTIRATGS
ncbi:MAG: endonuclease III [Dehalococcoidia bacterium]|nr:endonuclease III [Dehalococcoidia bacterium]